MRALRKERILSVFVIVALFVVTSFAGCAGESATFDFNSPATKLLIEQAASMPIRVLDDAKEGKLTNFLSQEDQTLTTAMLWAVVPPPGAPTDFVLGNIERDGGING